MSILSPFLQSVSFPLPSILRIPYNLAPTIWFLQTPKFKLLFGSTWKFFNLSSKLMSVTCKYDKKSVIYQYGIVACDRYVPCTSYCKWRANLKIIPKFSWSRSKRAMSHEFNNCSLVVKTCNFFAIMWPRASNCKPTHLNFLHLIAEYSSYLLDSTKSNKCRWSINPNCSCTLFTLFHDEMNNDTVSML